MSVDETYSIILEYTVVVVSLSYLQRKILLKER